MATKTKLKQDVLVALHGHAKPSKLNEIKSKLRPLEELGYHVVFETQKDAILAAAKKISSSGHEAAIGEGMVLWGKKPAAPELTLSDPVKAELGRLEHRIIELEANLLAAIRGEKVREATEASASSSLNEWDPYAEGRKLVQQLKDAEGGGLDRNEAAERLSITIPALHNRRKRGGIVAWTDGGADRFKFPSWQFGENGMLPGIEECLQALEGSDEWAIMRFFLFPSDMADGKRPLDLLREGRINDALELARARSIHA